MTDHCIFAHKNDAFSSQTFPNLVHLLRADIVNGHNEDGLVLFEQILELVEVDRLVCCLAPHVFLMEDRIFKGQEISIEGERGGLTLLSSSNASVARTPKWELCV